MKKIQNFYLNFQFSEVFFSLYMYLNRRVFVMSPSQNVPSGHVWKMKTQIRLHGQGLRCSHTESTATIDCFNGSKCTDETLGM